MVALELCMTYSYPWDDVWARVPMIATASGTRKESVTSPPAKRLRRRVIGLSDPYNMVEQYLQESLPPLPLIEA